MFLNVGSVHFPEDFVNHKCVCVIQSIIASTGHFAFKCLLNRGLKNDTLLVQIFGHWWALIVSLVWLLIQFLTLILYFSKGDSTVVGTSRLRDLYDKFEEELGSRQEKAKAARPPWEPPKTKLDEDLGESQGTRRRSCALLLLLNPELLGCVLESPRLKFPLARLVLLITVSKYIAVKLSSFWSYFSLVTFSRIHKRSHLQGVLTVVSPVELSFVLIRKDHCPASHQKQEPVPVPQASDGQAFPMALPTARGLLVWWETPAIAQLCLKVSRSSQSFHNFLIWWCLVCSQTRHSACLFLRVLWLSSVYFHYVSLAERQCPWWGRAMTAPADLGLNPCSTTWKVRSRASDLISLCLTFLICKRGMTASISHSTLENTTMYGFLITMLYYVNLL